MMVCCWEWLTELCLDDPKEIDSEQLTETLKETSLVDSSGEWMAMQMVYWTGQLMENLLGASLGCLLGPWMVMQMAQMKENDWVQLSEKHLGRMMVMNSAHLKAKTKEMHLVYLSAQLTEVQMVLTMEIGSVLLMEM